MGPMKPILYDSGALLAFAGAAAAAGCEAVVAAGSDLEHPTASNAQTSMRATITLFFFIYASST
jgi:hypothetical protein